MIGVTRLTKGVQFNSPHTCKPNEKPFLGDSLFQTSGKMGQLKSKQCSKTAKCNTFKIHLATSRNVPWTQWSETKCQQKKQNKAFICGRSVAPQIEEICCACCCCLPPSVYLGGKIKMHYRWRTSEIGIVVTQGYYILRTALAWQKSITKSKAASSWGLLSYPVVCVWNVHGGDSQVMDEGRVIAPCSCQVSHSVKGRWKTRSCQLHTVTYSIVPHI